MGLESHILASHGITETFRTVADVLTELLISPWDYDPLNNGFALFTIVGPKNTITMRDVKEIEDDRVHELVGYEEIQD